MSAAVRTLCFLMAAPRARRPGPVHAPRRPPRPPLSGPLGGSGLPAAGRAGGGGGRGRRRGLEGGARRTERAPPVAPPPRDTCLCLPAGALGAGVSKQQRPQEQRVQSPVLQMSGLHRCGPVTLGQSASRTLLSTYWDKLASWGTRSPYPRKEVWLTDSQRSLKTSVRQKGVSLWGRWVSPHRGGGKGLQG